MHFYWQTQFLKCVTWVFDLPKVVPIMLVSALAFVCALVFPWVAIPSLDSSVVDELGSLNLGNNNCWLAISFQLGLAILLPLVVIAWCAGKKAMAAKVLWCLLAWVLLFPTALQMWDPQFQIESERLDSSLAFVVYEMDLQHSMQQGDWRVWQTFSDISPKASTEVPNVLAWNLELLKFSNFPLILASILGYSDSFFAFSTRGWVLGIMGCVLGLLGLYLSAGQSLATLRSGLKFFFTVYVAVLVCVQTPSMLAEYYSDRGDYFGSLGSHGKAIDYYEKALAYKPVYSFSTRFLLKYGYLLKESGCESCLEAYLYNALTALLQNNLQEAYYWGERAALQYPDSKNVIYLMSGILNVSAIHKFNAQDYSEAVHLWRRSLMLDPLNAPSWYGLSLASVQLKKFDAASHQSAQIFSLQKYLGFKPLVVPAQIYLYRSWHLFSSNQLAAAHDVYRLSKLPETW
jgi:tetratricopeptide (TPR) repeat protein